MRLFLVDELVTYFNISSRNSSAGRVGLNGDIAVIGMVSAIEGPTQARNNDWKINIQLMSFVDEAVPRFETIHLELWIKQRNIESPEKIIPKAKIDDQMPIICFGDILFCDKIISSDGNLWTVGAEIERNCMVIPRKTIEKQMHAKKKLEYCHFDNAFGCAKTFGKKRGLDKMDAKSQLITKLKIISNNCDWYKGNLKSTESENDTYGLVLAMFATGDRVTDSISNLILDILPCSKNQRSDQISKIKSSREWKEDQIDHIVKIGDDFGPFVPDNVRKRIILDYASSRAALVQQIQPGCGIYITDIEIDTAEKEIENKMKPESNHSCLMVLPGFHPRVLSITKEFSQMVNNRIDSYDDNRANLMPDEDSRPNFKRPNDPARHI